GRLFEAGAGVARDPAQALVWYDKARAQGHERAGRSWQVLNAMQTATDRPQDAEQVRALVDAIWLKVRSHWRLPAGMKPDRFVELRLALTTDGTVESVAVMRGDGGPAMDESVVAAVRAASPLPVPSDPELFRKSFRIILIKFRATP
ncbi:MAG: TonB family protein, partial [Perlucidibaca sp.]